MPYKIFTGGLISFATGLFGEATGGEPVLIVIGVLGGIALGAVGIYERIQAGGLKKMQQRLDEAASRIDEEHQKLQRANDQAAEERRRAQDEISKLTRKIGELTSAVNNLPPCANLTANGLAWCAAHPGESPPPVPQASK
jgi:uncharacterized membrane-anchored protein YhcB (DUF1043 family)